VRTGRLIVQGTRVLQSSPGIEPTRRHSQEPQERRNGTYTRARSTARRIRILARPSGKRSCVNGHPELRRRASASRRSAVSFFTRRRSATTSCWSSVALRSVTSGRIMTFGAWPSHPRAVERGTPRSVAMVTSLVRGETSSVISRQRSRRPRRAADGPAGRTQRPYRPGDNRIRTAGHRVSGPRSRRRVMHRDGSRSGHQVGNRIDSDPLDGAYWSDASALSERSSTTCRH
jgi:hypothetical protein